MALDPGSTNFELEADKLIAAYGDELRDELLRPIFRYFAAHPLCDVGAPGTLVHFAEQFYPSYKPLLLRSLEQQPSYNTILMANRILNSQLEAGEREEYLRALASVSSSSVAAPELREHAKHFMEYQRGRG